MNGKSDHYHLDPIVPATRALALFMAVFSLLNIIGEAPVQRSGHPGQRNAIPGQAPPVYFARNSGTMGLLPWSAGDLVIFVWPLTPFLG
ncbi:MAG: hypothetical protein K9M57_01840 [Phycisphaerae bacterium]|nr:hypothetical protein [Phycisphaerae bacterium]